MKDCLPMKNRGIALSLLSTVLASCCFAASPGSVRADGFEYSTKEQVFAETQAPPCPNADRLSAVVDLFKRYGATDSDINIRDEHKIKNVVVTLAGAGPGYLVVGAHYDKVAAGCGALDNWTGIVLLAHAYKTLRQLRPQ